MNENEKLEILKEMRDRQKESIELQREQFEFIKNQYDRVEKINDKAEKIQDRAALMFKFIGPLIFVLIMFVVYLVWKYL